MTIYSVLVNDKNGSLTITHFNTEHEAILHRDQVIEQIGGPKATIESLCEECTFIDILQGEL